MAQGPEPSMEEILSSIKRIISEEDVPGPRRGHGSTDVEVLELTDAVSEPQTIAAPEPASFEPVSVEKQVASTTVPDRDSLISASTAAATRQALAALDKVTIRPENPASDNSLESLVRELLRPLLREWLDANLPRIVQATVDREVARLSGRGV